MTDLQNETAPVKPGEPPFVNLVDVADAWGWNARESAAYALGWRQAITYRDAVVVEPAVLIRCSRDQTGALLAALVDAGAQLGAYSGPTTTSGERTYIVRV